MEVPHPDVFLSYRRADEAAVRHVAARLRQAGIEPWLDVWHLIPGAPWQRAIEEALERCRACAVFLGPGGVGPWQDEELRAALDRRVREGAASFRVIPVLLPGAERGRRSRLPSFLLSAAWVELRELDDERGLHRLACGIRGVAPGPNLGEQTGRCPYRGLEAFEIEHAALFFGREGLTDWLLDALRPDAAPGRGLRFLAVVGASGSGKSSLARAGLLARLREGGIAGSEEWPLAVCRPGPEPLESLALALVPALARPATPAEVRDLARELAASERSLYLAAALALGDSSPPRRLVVLVDQFEELFTLCRREADRAAVIGNLVEAATAPGGRTVVVLTLRSDFLAECARHPRLAAALSDGQLLVGPPAREELREAIERPAAIAGGLVEPQLVAALLHDVEGREGGLPLLQHALFELWERREGGRLTLASYEALGGLPGALERRAEEVFGRLAHPGQALCRRLLLRLVRIDEGGAVTKRRVAVRDLAAGEQEAPAVERILAELASPEARLLTLEGEEGGLRRAELVHEALIEGWPRLRRWLDEDRELLLWRQRLQAAKEEWERAGREAGALLGGARLAEAEHWLGERGDELGTAEREFIAAGRLRRVEEAAAAEGRRRRTLLALGTGLLLVSALAALAGLSWRQAEARRREAEEQGRVSLSRALAAQALTETDGGLDLGLLLALEARRVAGTLEARRSLLAGLQRSPRLAAFLRGPVHRPWEGARAVRHDGLALSPDGATLAAVGARGSGQVVLWDLARRTVRQVLDVHGDIDCLAWSGGLLATCGRQGILLWDAHTGRPRGPALASPDEDVMNLAFSPDGSRLASEDMEGVTLWKVADRGIAHRLTGLRGLDLAFSPDGRTLATMATDDEVSLLDAVTGEPLGDPLYSYPGNVHSLAFSPDGALLAAGTAAGTVLVWHVETREPFSELTGHQASVYSLAFSPDGRLLASGDDEGAIRLWDVEGGGPAGPPLLGHTELVESLVFGPDGGTLVSLGDDDALILWEIGRERPLARRLVDGPPGTWFTLDQDGWRIAVASALGEQGLLSLPERTVSLADFQAATAAVSPDGKTLAVTGREGGAALFVAANGRPLWRQPKVPPGAWLAFSPDGKVLAAAGQHETLLLAAEGGRILWRAPDAKAGGIHLAFSPDGTVLASGSASHVRLWRTADGRRLAAVRNPQEELQALEFSPDGKTLAAAQWDLVVLYDPRTAAVRATLIGHPIAVNEVAFSPDGTLLASAGSEDGTFLLWDVATSRRLLSLPADGWAESVAFSPDGRLLALGSGSLQLLDLASRQPLGSLTGHTGRVSTLAFSPDGKVLATSDEDSNVDLWDLDLASWQARACAIARRNLTIEEWRLYLGDRPYRETCPGNTGGSPVAPKPHAR